MPGRLPFVNVREDARDNARDGVLYEDHVLAEIIANKSMSMREVCKLITTVCKTFDRCKDDSLWQAIALKMGITKFKARESGPTYERNGEEPLTAETYRWLVIKYCKISTNEALWNTAFFNAIQYSGSSDLNRLKWIVEYGDPAFTLIWRRVPLYFQIVGSRANVELFDILYSLAARTYDPDSFPFMEAIFAGLYPAIRMAAHKGEGAEELLRRFQKYGNVNYGSIFARASDNVDITTMKYMVERANDQNDDSEYAITFGALDIQTVFETCERRKRASSNPRLHEIYHWLKTIV